MEKNAHPFKQLLVLVGSHLGMLIALELILVVVVVAMVAGGNGDAPSMLSNLDGNMGLLMAMTFVQDTLLFVVPVLIVARCFYRDNKREFYRYDLSRSKWLLALAGVAPYALLTPHAKPVGKGSQQHTRC